MRNFATEIMLQGTAFVKTPNLEKAQRALENFCPTTVDARDPAWFADVASALRPKISFSNVFSLGQRLHTNRQIVTDQNVVSAQENWTLGWKDQRYVDELRPDAAPFPVFSVQLDLTAAAFVASETVEEAEDLFDSANHTQIDLRKDYKRLFSLQGLKLKRGSKVSVSLSSALYVVGRSKGARLRVAWRNGMANLSPPEEQAVS